jgi:hypothetical protein
MAGAIPPKSRILYGVKGERIINRTLSAINELI